MSDRASIRKRARHRAGKKCEYCHLPEEFASTPFQIDHVIAEKHGGKTSLDNTAWSCLHCNSFKGPNIAGRDDVTQQVVPLFDPRHDDWDEHFSWDHAVLRGLTPVGRATVAVLRINLPYRVAVRASLIDEGCFPSAT
jgi:5-methylcytosine-specific restriction endonuclease McrA